MTLTPWLLEAIILGVAGLSGVAGGVLMGWRHPLLLAGGAIAVTTSVRVFSSLSAWSFGALSLLQELWWGASLTLAIVGGVWALWRARRAYLLGLSGFAVLTVMSVSIKYLLAWGERHHRDSTSVVETALMIFQAEVSPLEWPPSVKRGLSFPLLLALGPDERLLAAATPLVFLSLITLVAWLASTVMAGRVPVRWQVTGGVLVGAFSLTVPIFRVALTYLNSHVLMALGLLMMVAGLLLANRRGGLGPDTMGLLAVGAVVATTARVEGIVSVAVLLAYLVSAPWLRTLTDRVSSWAVISLSGVTLAWWMEAVDTGIPESYGLTTLTLVTGVFVAGAVAVIPLFDKIRWVVFPLVVAVIGGLLLRIPLFSGDPLQTVMAQFNNVVRGYGGWGVAALALGVSLVLLGWRARSRDYRTLAVFSVVFIFVTLFSKLFDGDGFGGGGLGRDGFYDSVNRMWLHTLGIVATTMVVGYAEFLRDLFTKRHPDGSKKPALPRYTANTPADSKES